MTEMVLPRGWSKTRLGDLGKYINGRGFKKSEWGANGRPIIRIQNLTGSSKNFNYFDGEVEERYVVRPGDLLISWAATLGAYFWNGPEGLLNQHIFRVESAIEPRFHKYLLDYKLAELYAQTHGSGMVHITRGKFDAIEVLLPPLGEQRRIVEILEDHLSRLDAATATLRTAIARARSLTAAAATECIHSLGEDVPWSTVGTHAELVQYGSSSKTGAAASPSDVPVLRMGNIKDGRVDWSNLKYLPVDHADFPKLLLEDGDLLFNRTNSAEHVGKSAVFHGTGTSSFASYLIRVRFKGSVVADWANLVINSPQGRAYVASVISQQVGQANVNGAKLKAFPIPVPSVEEQQRLVAEQAELISSRDRLASDLDRAIAQAAALRRSLLVAAFSGRLTGSESDIERAQELALV